MRPKHPNTNVELALVNEQWLFDVFLDDKGVKLDLVWLDHNLGEGLILLQWWRLLVSLKTCWVFNIRLGGGLLVKTFYFLTDAVLPHELVKLLEVIKYMNAATTIQVRGF